MPAVDAFYIGSNNTGSTNAIGALTGQMRPVTYTSLCAGDDPTKVHLGFIAEEMALIDPRLVFYTWSQYQAQADGSQPKPAADAQLVPDGVQYDRIVPLLGRRANASRNCGAI